MNLMPVIVFSLLGSMLSAGLAGEPLPVIAGFVTIGLRTPRGEGDPC